MVSPDLGLETDVGKWEDLEHGPPFERRAQYTKTGPDARRGEDGSWHDCGTGEGF
jgi:hypothetical protein